MSILGQPARRLLHDASRDAAVETLMRLGYTYHGEVEWKPPAAPQLLTDEQKAEFVAQIIGYGTQFVMPIFAVVDSIERAARSAKADKVSHTGTSKREWVGLSQNEIDEIWQIYLSRESRVNAVDAALFGKNT